MILRPDNLGDLQEQLRAADRPIQSVNLNSMANLKQHKPEDMTATVEAGMLISDLQKALATCGQWLPIDPPNPNKLTIAELISQNLNGPRRYGFGVIRDWLIGIRFMLADGRLVHNGGNVVKNVAGFDLCKLLIGSRDSIGIVVETTFKLAPLPERESFQKIECESLDNSHDLIKSILNSELLPSVIDLYRSDSTGPILTIGFSGTAADVSAQVKVLKDISMVTEQDLDYDPLLRKEATHTHSILPSSLIDLIKKINTTPYVSRAGNGIVYSPIRALRRTPSNIEQRIKEIFDPKGILPPL